MVKDTQDKMAHKEQWFEEMKSISVSSYELTTACYV